MSIIAGPTTETVPLTAIVFKPCTFEDLVKMLHEFVLVLDPHGEIEVAWSSNADLGDQVTTGLLGRRVKGCARRGILCPARRMP